MTTTQVEPRPPMSAADHNAFPNGRYNARRTVAEFEQREALPPLPKLLLPGEEKELAVCEQIIERGLDTFIEVGIALATIRERRLYRVSFETFEAYCLARWEIRASRARQLCAAAETVRNLGLPPGSVTTGNVWALPASERQARPLMGLPPEEQRAAWAEAVATAPNGRLTSRHVEQIVKARRVTLGLGTVATAVESRAPGAASQPESVTTGNALAKPAAPTNRDERIKAQAERAIAEFRALLDLAGTADSEAASDLVVSLSKLENYRDHLVRVAHLQESRS